MQQLRTWLFICLFLGISNFAYSLDLKDNFQKIGLSKHMFILRDTLENLDFEGFYDNLATHNFSTTSQENFVEGFGSEIYWLYIPINFNSKSQLNAILEIINPDLNEIKIQAYRNGNLFYNSKLSGDKFQFNTREIEYKNFIYPIDFDPAFTNYEIIIRVNTEGEPFIFPIQLSSKKEFFKYSNLKNFGSGIYYCLLFMFIISLFIFYVISKEKMILYYIGYLTMLVLYLLDIEGLTNQYLLSKYPFFQSLEQPVLAGLLAFFFLKFSNRFFHFQKENYKLFQLVKWASNIIILLVLLMPLILNLPIIHKTLVLYIYLIVLLVSSISVYLVVAIKAFKSGLLKNYLFAITFGIEAIGFCIHFLVTHAYLPDHDFTRNILFYASIISLSFFSIYLIYLIDQINSTFKTLQLQYSEQKDKAFRNVMVGEEKERERISAILEEKIANKLNKSWKALQDVSQSKENKINIDKLNGITSDIKLALQNLESVNMNIAPSQLNKEGFKNTLERDLKMVQNTYPNMTFEFIIDEIEPFGFSEFDISVLYRIFEESLNNAIKHSRASKIDVHLLIEDHGLIYTIEDNGIGIQDPSGQFWGLGMKNIESRVSYLNGKLKVVSHPGKGTKMKVTIPSTQKLSFKIA